jgi:hypothetical protein|tara:strand:- start:128 stop:385 length:258 start_codon:yes stop_codon:yes gene_type:complete
MDERTPEEIAKIFLAASSSVNLINTKTAKGTDQTEEEWKDCIKRNVDHLEIIKGYKKLDKTTSIWTTENFTEIDAAIVKGKKVYS